MLRGVDIFRLHELDSGVWSVRDLTRYVRQTLETDYRLGDLWVVGEVSNLSRPASGHLYFTLRDTEASLRCVMWRPDVDRQGSLPRDGERAEVHGRIGVYEAGGQYQLYADTVRSAGEGERFQEYLRLKARLEGEGLFDPARKRPLPEWPERVGVVTSPTGAALQDVLRVLRRRFPLIEVILSPTPVQGEGAPAMIVAALTALNTISQPDVILVVRGGGSMEDLWAFNDESVVRAIAASDAPVVTGIGHETDVLLADFSADLRAPTPSAAAEVATPDRAAITQDLHETRTLSAGAFRIAIRTRRRELANLQLRLDRASPRAQLANARQRLDDLVIRARAAVRHDLELRAAAVRGVVQTLRVVGPADVLSRGYAVVTRAADGEIVRSVRMVEQGEGIDVRVSDGSFGARVDRGEAD
jgi:exodeoxyribonuclease VII large subunit